MIIHANVAQGTEEWYRMRMGRPTASRFKDIITPAKGLLSKAAESYAIELIAQCFCPDVQNDRTTFWMDRGIELEPQARKAFEAHTGLAVEQVGFVTQDNGVVGCSPDGMIKDTDGKYVAGLELKCLTPKGHVEAVLNGVLPDEYKAQVHGGMAVTGLHVWHFFSYMPGMKPFHLAVQRDDFTAKLETALQEFLVMYGELRLKLIPKLQLHPKP